MKLKIFSLLFTLFITLSASSANAVVEVPVESDSRIRTVIYNENEVFTFITRHGFQSSIEFAQDEIIETISIGDAIGWQVTPAGRRIFIKPLQRNGITNLTVITNKHSYQLELVATDSSGRYSNHAYVLKFFYPDNNPVEQLSIEDRTRGSLRPVSPTYIPDLPTQPSYQAPEAEAVVLPGETPDSMGSLAAPPSVDVGLNFNYSLTGPDSIAPTKIYDDGKSTFFEITGNSADLKFSTVFPDGSEIPVSARQQGNLAIVDQISPKMTIRRGDELICIYNENMLSTGPMVR